MAQGRRHVFPDRPGAERLRSTLPTRDVRLDSSHISRILSPSYCRHHNPQAKTASSNASTESISTICKLIESANIHCILFAIKKYLDDLQQGNIFLEQREKVNKELLPSSERTAPQWKDIECEKEIPNENKRRERPSTSESKVARLHPLAQSR